MVEVHAEAGTEREVVDEVPPPVLIHEVVLVGACLIVDFLQFQEVGREVCDRGVVYVGLDTSGDCR